MHAGEPYLCLVGARQKKVYPRGCGGATEEPSETATDWGLSPRVRGSLLRAVIIAVNFGSIPAGAGEPIEIIPASFSVKVYPRGCGGA